MNKVATIKQKNIMNIANIMIISIAWSKIQSNILPNQFKDLNIIVVIKKNISK